MASKAVRNPNIHTKNFVHIIISFNNLFVITGTIYNFSQNIEGTDKLSQRIMFQACIREVPDSNVVQDSRLLTEIFFRASKEIA
jgi:hypothetical protein